MLVGSGAVGGPEVSDWLNVLNRMGRVAEGDGTKAEICAGCNCGIFCRSTHYSYCQTSHSAIVG